MSRVEFFEKERDWNNEATRYWFRVDGEAFAVVESGPLATIITESGDEVYDRNLEAKLRAELVATDEMRAA